MAPPDAIIHGQKANLKSGYICSKMLRQGNACISKCKAMHMFTENCLSEVRSKMHLACGSLDQHLVTRSLYHAGVLAGNSGRMS